MNKTIIATILISLSAAASAFDFNINWTLNPKESFNAWASRMRFQVNDNLVFKYDQTDSILVVKKEDFDSCNASSPIQKLEGGNSKFELTRPGPYYFVSGVADRCKNGEKMVLVVITPRGKKQPTVASPPGKSPPSVGSQPASSPMTPGDRISPSTAPGSSAPEPKSSGSVLRVGTSAMVVMMVVGYVILG